MAERSSAAPPGLRRSTILAASRGKEGCTTETESGRVLCMSIRRRRDLLVDAVMTPRCNHEGLCSTVHAVSATLTMPMRTRPRKEFSLRSKSEPCLLPSPRHAGASQHGLVRRRQATRQRSCSGNPGPFRLAVKPAHAVYCTSSRRAPDRLSSFAAWTTRP